MGSKKKYLCLSPFEICGQSEKYGTIAESRVKDFLCGSLGVSVTEKPARVVKCFEKYFIKTIILFIIRHIQKF